MDALLRQIERSARALPGDPTQALSHARELARAGQPLEARAEVQARMSERCLDTQGLSFLCELGRQQGSLGPARGEVPRARVDRVIRGPIGGARQVELAPTVAFVGPADAECWRSVGALVRLFGGDSPEPRSCELIRSYVAYGERVLDMRVPLRSPWFVSEGFDALSLRLLCLPGDPGSGKFRRRLMRSVSAYAVRVPRGAGDDELSRLVGSLEIDQRRAADVGLGELPLLFHYDDPAGARAHARRAAALGLPQASWAVGSHGLVDGLAWLLLELSRGVRQGLVRPRVV